LRFSFYYIGGGKKTFVKETLRSVRKVKYQRNRTGVRPPYPQGGKSLVKGSGVRNILRALKGNAFMWKKHSNLTESRGISPLPDFGLSWFDHYQIS